ncbi:hypothetical protein SGGMMB4_03591 [Sodalis glossinidius str. 'morsitans']|uniref:Uncharacterized protein n=1 Tax=Sodalis glossinidius (strain morsitans) TaxID=343509 RepID=A0A193QKM5_SODGM|nr:hypothetical protein [Sodalis glossinidius]CRL45648.1 hypothetical protein SGGMMB4_03591 [Sodalis glossinidius str. 'morsitans']
MKIGRHSPLLPPASSANPSVTRQQNEPQAVPVALSRTLSLPCFPQA